MGFYDAATLFSPFYVPLDSPSSCSANANKQNHFPDSIYAVLAKMDVYIIRY
jgi:hypothetical protein